MPQQKYFGFNSINHLKKILSKHNPSHIFLVTGRNSYEKSGAKDALNALLKGYNATRFCDFEENPKLFDVERGMKVFKKNKCNFVIAVGGGSVIDVAKSVRLFAANDGKPEDYLQKGKSIRKKGKVLIAVPTTAGSGSEATKFAVVYIDKIKHSLEHEFVLPDYAIVDPQFTMSLPKYITACTGMDAFSQAIESYWSVNSADESKRYAREAIKLIMANLANAVNKPSEKSREAMAKAANLAGKAINITRTTACHAISYPITSYFNVPHGHAVALTLGQMLIYNSNVTKDDLLDKRGVNYVKKIISEIVKLLEAENTEDAGNKIKNLMNEIGLSARLSGLGIKSDEDIELIIRNGFDPSRVNNNPRKLTEGALRRILNEIR